MPTKIRCKMCSKTMIVPPSVALKKNFCSNECYRRWSSINIRGSNHHGYKLISINCPGCRKEISVKPYQIKGKQKFCSHACYTNSRKGVKPVWIDYSKPRSLKKGGRTHISGYIFVRCLDHPKATKGGYVAEHVLVAEAILGKYLPNKAVIHHVNGIRTDNKPSNLVICQDNNYHFLLHNRQNKLRKESCNGNH